MIRSATTLLVFTAGFCVISAAVVSQENRQDMQENESCASFCENAMMMMTRHGGRPHHHEEPNEEMFMMHLTAMICEPMDNMTDTESTVAPEVMRKGYHNEMCKNHTSSRSEMMEESIRQNGKDIIIIKDSFCGYPPIPMEEQSERHGGKHGGKHDKEDHDEDDYEMDMDKETFAEHFCEKAAEFMSEDMFSMSTEEAATTSGSTSEPEPPMMDLFMDLFGCLCLF